MFLIYDVFTYIQFNKYTHLLIQTYKISHRGIDSEIVLRAQKPLLACEPNCVVYIFVDTVYRIASYLIWRGDIGKCHNLLLSLKGNQKGKVTCYARQRVNKNELF